MHLHKFDPIYYLTDLLRGRVLCGSKKENPLEKRDDRFYFIEDWTSLQLNKAKQGVTNQRPVMLLSVG